MRRIRRIWVWVLRTHTDHPRPTRRMTTMTMPTTEDNARAVASQKGYAIDEIVFDGEGRRIAAFDPITMQVHGAADDWTGALRMILALPKLGVVGDRLASSMAEMRAEIDGRGDPAASRRRGVLEDRRGGGVDTGR